MTEARASSADPWTAMRARRRRARRVMQSLIVVCVVAAAGVGAEQFYTGGLHAFLDRPPGVGATPPQSQSVPARPAPLPSR